MGREATRHDPETIKLGLSKIAEIRAQLAERNPNMRQGDRTQPASREPIEPVPHDHPTVDERSVTVDSWSPDKISAEMAAGSERDHLRERITALEAEVAQLRSALAAVLAAAATGLHADESATTEPQASAASHQ